MPAVMSRFFPVLLAALMSMATGAVVAQHHESHGAAPERVLGKVEFPTTATSPEAQAAFIRGMLLLHLFEYDFARREFRQAQELEPAFAMAYWGEAMTHNHPLWDRQDREAARTALGALAATPEGRAEAAGDERERAFLVSLESLYGESPKAQRDRRYAHAMEQMAARWPDDHEVQLFYALSLMGVHAGVRDIPTYMMATALAQSVFSDNPEHPGAAHYLIHSVDDPVHAVLGLEAARALARMAPDAGHSQHMTSHIFNALGMWDETVAANSSAVEVQNRMRGEQGQPARNWGHYNFWLLYGHLQQGRVAGARELLRAAFDELQQSGKSPVDPMVLDADESQVGSVVQMWARYVIETRDWTGSIAGWEFNMGDAYDPNLLFTLIQGMRAAHGGQAAGVQQYLDQFRELRGALAGAIRAKDEPAPTDLLYLRRLEVLERQLQAGIEMARGETSKAAELAGDASRLEGEMPYAYGPPFVDLPSAELWGELLIESGKYTDAAAAFELQLERARQRPQALFGLLRTQRRLGQDVEARRTARLLGGAWHAADPEVKAVFVRVTEGLENGDAVN